VNGRLNNGTGGRCGSKAAGRIAMNKSRLAAAENLVMSLEVLERVQMVSLMFLGLSDGTICLYLLVGWIQFGYCGLNGVLVWLFLGYF
jgi:hypothetical protein